MVEDWFIQIYVVPKLSFALIINVLSAAFYTNGCLLRVALTIFRLAV
jgi:hypothetical protein